MSADSDDYKAFPPPDLSVTPWREWTAEQRLYFGHPGKAWSVDEQKWIEATS